MTTTTESALDQMLAPLDEIARDDGMVTLAMRERAYGLALLSAELLGRADRPDYLYQYLAATGLDAGAAQTIARAFASAMTRVAGWVEQRSGRME